MDKGYIQIYTGDGKGKTTAALGLGVRAVGNGLKVLMIQFLKGSHTSELESVKAFGDSFQIIRLAQHEKFFWQLNDGEKETFMNELQQELHQVEEEFLRGKWDIIILDEIFGALSNKMLTTAQLEHLIEIKPMTMELIMTGREVPSSFVEKADLVTEMKSIKHYYDRGISSRKGIEY